jgi:hypothetical protein
MKRFQVSSARTEVRFLRTVVGKVEASINPDTLVVHGEGHLGRVLGKLVGHGSHDMRGSCGRVAWRVGDLCRVTGDGW